MKATVATLEQESFLSGLALKLENGLILRTFDESGVNMVWFSESDRFKVVSQFDEFLDRLEADGWEIEGRDILEEHRG